MFKARLQSPGKGGALLVGKAVDPPLFRENNPNKKLQILYSSSGSDIDSHSSDYLMAKKKKVKCKRKTRKEISAKVCAFQFEILAMFNLVTEKKKCQNVI